MASEESRHVYSSIQVGRVSCNVSFLISTENLSPSDAAIDAMGVWKLSKTKAKKCRGQMVRRRTYRNKACKDLVKAVVEPEEQQFPYVFIQYRFEGEPCSFDLLPHGNSKTSQSPYVRVNPSTMQLLKEETDGVASARKAFHNVEKKVGGLTGASAVSQLPRNTKQVYNMKSRKPKSMGSIREDPLFRSLNSMEMEDDQDRFHQQFIKTAGSTTHLLFNRRQVNDIKSLCTEFGKSSVLSVDVTFKLGPFWVLVTTYQNLILRRKGQQNHPVMIGPVALVKDKTEKSYSHLFKALVSEEPSLSQSLKGSGSDGEINVEKALDSSFQQAYRFRCANHLFNDVREKARQIGLPRATVESCIEELRNSCLTSTRESGATDLGNLVESWQKSADAGFKEPMTRFCSYVLRFVIPVIRDRVMAGNAELAGFPQFSKVLYTQNVSESGNAMLKNWTGFKESEVDAFILDLKELVTREEDDVARALVGLDSPYEVLEEFRPFVSKSADHLINADLTELERKRRKAKLINQAFSVVLSQADEFQPLGIHDARPQEEDTNLKTKGMPQLDDLAGLGFSEPMINGIRQKAQKLIAGDLVTRAFSGDQSRFVKSYSSNKPHLVQPHKQLGYRCDESCLQYKANKVCAHTVAAACDNNNLEGHIQLLVKANPKGSLDALCSGKPDAGKKANHKKKRARRRSPVQGSEFPKRTSTYPWRESCQPFVITRKQKRRVPKCPGCRKEFDESPPEMDIIVIHREKDWRAGTDKVTPVDNPRGYHLNLACIRARHPDFLRNPQNSKLVKDFDPNKEEEDLIVNALDLDMIPPSE